MAKIEYEKLNNRRCVMCCRLYKPTGPAQKVCVICRKHMDNITAQVNRDIARFKKFGSYNHIGQGGTNKHGKAHPQYKNGAGYFAKRSPQIRSERKVCKRCDKDVQYGKYAYAVHHIDHNRDNNPEDDSNYELLCRRCHQLEHDCWYNLLVRECPTTISEESTPK